LSPLVVVALSLLIIDASAAHQPLKKHPSPWRPPAPTDECPLIVPGVVPTFTHPGTAGLLRSPGQPGASCPDAQVLESELAISEGLQEPLPVPLVDVEDLALDQRFRRPAIAFQAFDEPLGRIRVRLEVAARYLVRHIRE